MNPLISIIIPVYNSEKYLLNCINRIINQSYDHLEILLINDGSSDSSPIICENYAQTDKRIKVFHKENGGVSSARNLGLKEATGDYICFIDSDDIIDLDYIKCFINEDSLQSDIIIQGFTSVQNGEQHCITFNPASLNNITEISSFVKNTLPISPEGFVLRAPWAKLYKKTIIGSLSFDHSISFSEDYLFNLQIYQRVNSISIVDGCGYYYLQDNSTLTFKKYPMEEYLSWHKKIQDEVYLLANKWNTIELFENVVQKRFNYLFSSLIENSDDKLKNKYFTYSYIHRYLNQSKCKNIHLNRIVELTRKLPRNKFSFILLLIIIKLKQTKKQFTIQ